MATEMQTQDDQLLVDHSLVDDGVEEEEDEKEDEEEDGVDEKLEEPAIQKSTYLHVQYYL